MSEAIFLRSSPRISGIWRASEEGKGFGKREGPGPAQVTSGQVWAEGEVFGRTVWKNSGEDLGILISR